VALRAMVMLLSIAAAPPAIAGADSDTDVMTLVHKHCVMCHAATPTHESFQEARKNVVLETIPELKKHAASIYMQTVKTQAMPLGNQTGMTEDERARLGQWLKELP
jgi:uncharacterized membrane protein